MEGDRERVGLGLKTRHTAVKGWTLASEVSKPEKERRGQMYVLKRKPNPVTSVVAYRALGTCMISKTECQDHTGGEMRLVSQGVKCRCETRPPRSGRGGGTGGSGQQGLRGTMDVACLEAPCHGERKEACWCDSEDGGPSHERRKVTGGSGSLGKSSLS